MRHFRAHVRRQKCWPLDRQSVPLHDIRRAQPSSLLPSPEGHDLLELADVLEELGGASEGHSLDGLASLARVLVMHAQVGAARLHRLRRVFGLSGITRHLHLTFLTNLQRN